MSPALLAESGQISGFLAQEPTISWTAPKQVTACGLGPMWPVKSPHTVRQLREDHDGTTRFHPAPATISTYLARQKPVGVALMIMPHRAEPASLGGSSRTGTDQRQSNNQARLFTAVALPMHARLKRLRPGKVRGARRRPPGNSFPPT
jgi:hypothetical protein